MAIGFNFLDPGKRVRTWNTASLRMIYGSTIVTGFAENSILTVTPTADAFSEVIGTMLEHDRIFSGIRSFDITFSLKQTSSANADFSLYLNTDLFANSGALPLVVKDLSGLTTFISTQAYIVSCPSQEFRRSMSSREWKLRTLNGYALVGGN
jgi:hypothetical protein